MHEQAVYSILRSAIRGLELDDTALDGIFHNHAQRSRACGHSLVVDKA